MVLHPEPNQGTTEIENFCEGKRLRLRNGFGPLHHMVSERPGQIILFPLFIIFRAREAETEPAGLTTRTANLNILQALKPNAFIRTTD
jgi:hypothetical protein